MDIGDDDLDSIYPLEMFEGLEHGPVMLATEQQIQELQQELEQHQPQQVQFELELEEEPEQIWMPLQANEQHQSIFALFLQANGQLPTPPSSP